MPAAHAPSALGVELRWMRGMVGLSGGDMADRLEVAQGTVSRWETGKRTPNPLRVEAWRAISAYLVRKRIRQGGLSARDRRSLIAALARLESEDYMSRLRRLVSAYVAMQTPEMVEAAQECPSSAQFGRGAGLWYRRAAGEVAREGEDASGRSSASPR